MTPHQVFIVAAIGGSTGVICVALIVGLVMAACDAASNLADVLSDRRAARRQSRADVIACRAIDALGTTNHPKE